MIFACAFIFFFLSLAMHESAQNNILVVQASEAGQKLLQFLVRRLSLPQSLLHRWIRTGQIRINGSRAKPFMLTEVGDNIRMPPFALNMSNSATANNTSKAPTQHQNLPEVIYEDEHLLIFNKPYGLPVHSGTGHVDSLATRLEGHYNQDLFKPTPAHRLDKDTTGVIIVARSYASLRALQDSFGQRTIIKEYLAWIQGIWPHKGPVMLQHSLAKRYEGYDEKVHTLPQEQGRASESIVTCLQHEDNCSLMHIRLITGRTHQIRVQFAAEGFPVFGDGKYGQGQNQQMRLHAFRITLPNTEPFVALGLQNKTFTIFPPWGNNLSFHDTLDIL